MPDAWLDVSAAVGRGGHRNFLSAAQFWRGIIICNPVACWRGLSGIAGVECAYAHPPRWMIIP